MHILDPLSADHESFGCLYWTQSFAKSKISTSESVSQHHHFQQLVWSCQAGLRQCSVSLLNYTGANPEDFTGSVPKIAILSMSHEPGCSGSTNVGWGCLGMWCHHCQEKQLGKELTGMGLGTCSWCMC